jgi:hypothetical protein
MLEEEDSLSLLSLSLSGIDIVTRFMTLFDWKMFGSPPSFSSERTDRLSDIIELEMIEDLKLLLSLGNSFLP